MQVLKECHYSPFSNSAAANEYIDVYVNPSNNTFGINVQGN